MELRLRTIGLVVLAAPVMGLYVWLFRRDDVETLRLGIIAAVWGLAIVLAVLSRKNKLLPPLCIAAAFGFSVLLVLSAPGAHSLYFEEFLRHFIGIYVIGTLIWFYLRQHPLPPNSPEQLKALGLLGIMLGLALGAASIALWQRAQRVCDLPNLPQLTRLNEMDQTPEADTDGIFLLGLLLSDPGAGIPLASVGGGLTANFPRRLDITLLEGGQVQIGPLASVHQAVNWPECGDWLGQQCLHNGDPVIVLGDKIVVAEGQARLDGLKAVIFGSQAMLNSEFLTPAFQVARLVGYLVLVLLPISLLPIWRGIRILRAGPVPKQSDPS